MLTTKAVVLILIALVNGEPVARHAGNYATATDCAQAFSAMQAAAFAKQVYIKGVCIVTPFDLKKTGA